MTGRMELEEKVKRRTKRIVAKEPKYLNTFNVYMGSDNKTAQTRENYIRHINKFINYLKADGTPVEKEEDFRNVSINNIRSYIQDDDDNVISKRGMVSDSYKYMRHFALNCFFNFLEDGRFIDRNPMERIKTPSRKRMKQKVYLNVSEVREIESNVKNGDTNRTGRYIKEWGKRDAAIINLGFKNALRVSAIVSINVEDINWKEKYIDVIEKGNRPRHVVISNNTIEVLKEWVEKRNEYVEKYNIQSNALFISRKSKRITSKTVGEIIRSYAGELNNNKRIVPHTMRSSTATNSYLACKDVFAVQKLLGHSSLAVTQNYLNDSIDNQRKMVDLVENIYGDDDNE